MFAQRHTFYDVFFMLLRGSEEESAFSILIGCVCMPPLFTNLALLAHASARTQLHLPRPGQLHRRKCVHPPSFMPARLRRLRFPSLGSPWQWFPPCSPSCSRCRRSSGAFSPAWCALCLPSALPSADE